MVQGWGMDGEALVREAERLAGELAGSGLRELGKRWRCPAELRFRVVAYARQCRERGEPVSDIAIRLGLVESTLARWLRRGRAEEATAGFRPVAIVPVGGVSGADQVAALTLVTPGGCRVEGLDVESAAYLLRVLG